MTARPSGFLCFARLLFHLLSPAPHYPCVDEAAYYVRHRVIVPEPVPKLLSEDIELLHPAYGVLDDDPGLRQLPVEALLFRG